MKPQPEKVELLATSPRSEYDRKFLQGMLNRMSVSFHKYGAVADAFPSRLDALASAHQRIDKYLETLNTEFLIDAANFMMIEFMQPSREGAFFEGTDSDQAPGRVTTDGTVSHGRNETL